MNPYATIKTVKDSDIKTLAKAKALAAQQDTVLLHLNKHSTIFIKRSKAKDKAFLKWLVSQYKNSVTIECDIDAFIASQE